MSRRSISSRTTTVVTSNSSARKQDNTSNGSWLAQDEFEKRPKTDYTYARSATYSNKYVDGGVISPNLSRRRLYTHDSLKDSPSASELMRTIGSESTTVSSRVHRYGARPSRNSNQNNNLSQPGSMLTRSATTTSTLTADNGAAVDNLNNGESVFSSDDDSSVMSRSTGRKRSASKRRAPSRSPGRSGRTGVGKRLVSKYDDTIEKERTTLRSRSYALPSGLDNDSEALEWLTNENTKHNAGAGGNAICRHVSPRLSHSSPRLSRSSSYQSHLVRHMQSPLDIDLYGIDNMTVLELITEKSSTVIDTVSTGSPLTAKLMGCCLFIYGCTRIFINRVWYSFGYPVYTTLQRYLLLDTWLLSRPFIHRLRSLLLALLLLLLPILLIAGFTCSLHAIGLVSVAPCAQLTGIYYVNKQSDINAPGLSDRLQKTLLDMFTWSDRQQPVVLTNTEGVQSVDWNGVMDEKLLKFRAEIDLQSNKEVSVQRQKYTDLEVAVIALSKDVDDLKGKLSSLSLLAHEVEELKRRLEALQSEMRSRPNYKDAITSLQQDLHRLQLRLGEVNLEDKDDQSSGVLLYLYNEINNLADITKYVLGLTDIEPVLRAAMQTTPTAPPPPQPCPDSSCACESELSLRLETLRGNLMSEIESKVGTGATVFLNSDNSSGLSEQVVKKIVQDELDVFAADMTGMPDFALQSMGAQVVSTRCSQTYYQDSSLMTYFGLPLYHLHKDPSIVIQPGVTPGECWCFHGSSGSLVIELADTVNFNSFSLEHISARQSVTGDIPSAPKDIEIYGLTSELDSDGTRIGRWRYDRNGPRLQFFPVQDPSVPGFHVVELRVLTNWGRPEYTCLYRFRVHGKLAPK